MCVCVCVCLKTRNFEIIFISIIHLFLLIQARQMEFKWT